MTLNLSHSINRLPTNHEWPVTKIQPSKFNINKLYSAYETLKWPQSMLKHSTIVIFTIEKKKSYQVLKPVILDGLSNSKDLESRKIHFNQNRNSFICDL
jgi:hypothetical protein